MDIWVEILHHKNYFSFKVHNVFEKGNALADSLASFRVHSKRARFSSLLQFSTHDSFVTLDHADISNRINIFIYRFSFVHMLLSIINFHVIFKSLVWDFEHKHQALHCVRYSLVINKSC